jgi:hypothetical protein
VREAVTARDDTPSAKPLLDKLGVKPESRVSVIGIDDADFLALLRTRTGEVSVGRAKTACDSIFYGVPDRRALIRIATLRRSLQPAGALWTVRPKGSKAVTEAETRAAGLAAGLVDVKVVSFSATHTAEKFVIPLASR